MNNLTSKALGLVVITLSVIAPTAGAAEITAEDYPAVLTGGQEGAISTNYVETTSGLRFTCETIDGELTLSQSSSTVLVTPHLAGCTAHLPSGTTDVSFDLNECTFEAIAGERTPETEQVHGSLKVTCLEEESITATILTCQVHIPPQEISDAVIVTNLESGQVTIEADTSGKLHYEETDGFLCPFEGNSTLTEGTLVANVLVTGYEDLGTAEDPDTSGIIDHMHSEEQLGLHVE